MFIVLLHMSLPVLVKIYIFVLEIIDFYIFNFPLIQKTKIRGLMLNLRSEFWKQHQISSPKYNNILRDRICTNYKQIQSVFKKKLVTAPNMRIIYLK